MDANGFKQAMAKLPEPVTDEKPPYWSYWRHDLYKRVLTEDVTQFWEWPCIFHTMCQNHWPHSIGFEFGQLDRRFWDACLVPHFGPDDRATHISYSMDAGNFSMNLIHQAYHIRQWEQTTGQRIAALDTIVEFGGGYGAMALLCHRLGFDGKYIIYDLPEFSLLQEYYLSHFGLLDKVTWNPKSLNKALGGKKIDLFMALYSLSEVSPEDRVTGETHFYAKSYLFLYSGKWQEWDNVDWFQRRWATLASSDLAKAPVTNWQHTELTHLPDGNNWYTLGW